MLANDFSFKNGMLLEVEILDTEFINSKDKEYFDSSLRDSNYFYLTVAIVENVNATGQLLIKTLDSDSTYWVDANSNRLHPCGYWNYIVDTVYSSNDEHLKQKPLTLEMIKAANFDVTSFKEPEKSSFFDKN